MSGALNPVADTGNEAQLRVIREIAELFGAAHIRFWLRGGWALDFLLGEITRPHGDIDPVTWRGMLGGFDGYWMLMVTRP